MKMLGIETSGKICGLALSENERILVEYNLNLGLKHSELLLPLIEQALNTLHWQIENLDGIAVDIGPGSFTGIRIGLSVARTLAQLLNIPLAGIVSLDALAENIPPCQFLLLPLVDALGGMVYTTLYQYKKEKWQRLLPYRLTNIDTLLNLYKTREKPILFIGEGALVYKKKIKNRFKRAYFAEDNFFPHALSIARLGREKLREKKGGNFSQVLPFYLRRSYAEEQWSPRPPLRWTSDEECR